MEISKINKRLLFFVLFSLTLSSCNSWFDFASQIWNAEIAYVSDDDLSFGKDSSPQTLKIENSGAQNHSQISFSISADVPWVYFSMESGVVPIGEDQPIQVFINRTLLPEGLHSGIISVDVDADSNTYKVPVSAIGFNDVSFNPKYINFGSTTSDLPLDLYSFSGTRDIELSTPDDWLTISDKDITLVEYDEEKRTGMQTIKVSCKRDQLVVGEHSSSIDGVSGHGEHLFSIPVTVTIPPQGDYVFSVDNYVFTLQKHLYWQGEKVVLELEIKNHKYLKRFELVASESFALADNNSSFSVSGTSVTISPNEKETMLVYIHDVPQNVSLFTNITLSIRDLSQKIVFHNINL